MSNNHKHMNADNKDRDAWWLETNAAKRGLKLTEDITEAFIERVAIEMSACRMAEDQARRTAFREMFEE